MTKAEMEKAIINAMKHLVDINNDRDKFFREHMAKEISHGTSPEVFADMFFFNGYIYMSQLINIICSVMFEHSAEEEIIYDTKTYKGVAKAGGNYNYVVTDEEEEKIQKVINGMVKANIIRISKSGIMVKLLKEV